MCICWKFSLEIEGGVYTLYRIFEIVLHHLKRKKGNHVDASKGSYIIHNDVHERSNYIKGNDEWCCEN